MNCFGLWRHKAVPLLSRPEARRIRRNITQRDYRVLSKIITGNIIVQDIFPYPQEQRSIKDTLYKEDNLTPPLQFLKGHKIFLC